MKNRIFCLLLSLIMVVGMLASCVAPTTPPTGSTCTSHTDANHDGLCDTAGCSGTVELVHVDANRDTVCDVPGCGAYVEIPPCATHTDTDGDDVCDVCSQVLIAAGNYPWERTTLRFAVNMHSHYGELTSGSKRYLAGAADGTALVKEVSKRNSKAQFYTKTNIQYEYWSDGKEEDIHDWEDSNAYIKTCLGRTGNTQIDMYSTFLFDMMCASLDRSFANLKTKNATNYFEFVVDNDYADTVGDEEGYMMEFMQSLTLSVNKMYLLASDYFVDTVRAFFIVPVNVSLLNELGQKILTDNNGTLPSEGPFMDRTNDGQFTIEDFVELVWAREWTYDAIQMYSNAVYRDSDNSGGLSAKDTLGFVLESGSGFSSTGVVYTSSITIIDKYQQMGEWNYCYPAVEKNESTGQWVYNSELDSFESAQALFDLETAVTALFQTQGVLASAGLIKTDYQVTNDDKELVCIRRKFTSSENSLLFGGFIMTGNLDETEAGDYNDYQDMRKPGAAGFAIAPCPLYAGIDATKGEQCEDPKAAGYRDYQTLIHNVGRLGAISVNTTKFAQCSAFLDYQSRHSSDILEEYYQEKLCRAAGNENDNNVVMDFIRDHVRSIFDKAFEDALGYFYKAQFSGTTGLKKWHDFMKTNNFQPDGAVAGGYSTMAPAKQQLLIELQGEYENLPELAKPQQ